MEGQGEGIAHGVTSATEQVAAEAELARRLAAAPEEERRRLYGPAYDRIYEMHLSRDPGTLDFGADLGLMPMLLRLTEPGDRVLEIGCGTGLLAVELAKARRKVIGVDVSEVALDAARRRAEGVEDVTFQRVDGVALPFEPWSFVFAYSVEVIEHMHEDDARAHFAEVQRVVRWEGGYWFLTPHRRASLTARERFDVETDADADVHLKEWTYTELRGALKAAGFAGAKVPLRDYTRRSWPMLPLGLAATLERTVRPESLRDRLGLTRCSVVARTY